jgi:hypothetical protein
MKYVSADIETTCLSPKRPENILGISMVVEDSDHPEVPLASLPHFTCFISHNRVEGTHYALWMNAWILLEINNYHKAKPTKYPVYWGESGASNWVDAAMKFLDHHFGGQKINIAGKNVAGFDMQFFPEILANRFRHRVIDPGSVMIDWSQQMCPDLSTLKKRSGLSEVVSHDMYEDALDVIAVLRTTYPRVTP